MSLYTYQYDHDDNEDHDNNKDHDDDDYDDYGDNDDPCHSWYKLMKANWERAWRIKVATAKVIST